LRESLANALDRAGWGGYILSPSELVSVNAGGGMSEGFL